MASSVSKLDGHRQQDQVDRWLLAGKTVRWVAGQLDPPVSFQSVQRYRKNLLGPALKRVASKLSGLGTIPVTTVNGGQLIERPLREVTQEARLDERVNPFVQRADALYLEAWTALQDAKNAVTTITDSEGKERIRGRDLGIIAPIINAAARSLELFGRGAGYLSDHPGGDQVIINCLLLPSKPGPPEEDIPVLDIVVDPRK